MAGVPSVEKMQESWVEVQEQREGTLTHTSSKEELKQLLASAASEEELSDSDVVYQVRFGTADSPEREEEKEPTTTQVSPPSFKRKHYQSSTIPVPLHSSLTSRRSVRDGICSLTLLVPVILLTHLAVFGIGYFIGRRCNVDASSAVMRVFHV